MEFKAPTPLGGGKTVVRKEEVVIQPIANKQRTFKLPKIPLPKIPFLKISLRKIKLPHINLSKTQKQKLTYYLLIGVPSILLIILFILIAGYTKSEPYRIANEFLQKVEEKDTTKAYRLTTDAYRAVVSEREFRKIVTKLNSVDISKADLVEKRIEGYNSMGQYAYVLYHISGYKVEIVLFNDTYDWGILSIDFSLISE